MTRSQVGPPTPTPTSSPSLSPFPTIDDRVQQSIDLWARDLRTLFDDARERFSDVSWETDIGDRVWAHKAIVYVRAPKAFKDRYFITGAKTITLARSPTSLSGPSPTPYLLSASSARGSPSPNPWRAAASSLSVDTAGSDGTLRAPTVSIAGSSADGVLRLRHEDAPELFRAQLEWLYTGEGFGDVVEWISGEREGTSNTSLRDSLGRRGDVSERRDKLGQDLTYMWTSKLYCDVRIHLASPDGDGYDSDSSGASDDSLAATVIFTAHRFMLISRSPYFATLFLNEDFRPSTADVHLSTPPFTPAALHFCLGWMYAGHLDFSNRSYDLLTAFQIYRAAEYLQLDCLVEEIESRIVHDFCDGLDYDRCHCRRCLSRVPRVWRFAGASDVGALELQRRARRFILRGWGETWGREIGMADKAERDDLVRDVLSSMTPSSVVGAFRGIANIRRRIDHFTHTRGADTTGWVDAINEMVEPIQRRAREFLASSFPQVCESKELWALFSGKGFADEVLDIFWREVVEMTGRSPTFTVAPVVYETIVTALLRKVDPKTLEAVLPTRSANRHKVEMARDAVLKHIKKRWVSIQNEGGFVVLKGRTLQEIASAIEVPAKELAATPQVPFPRARDNGFPRTTSRAQGLGDRVRRTSARNSVQSDTATEPNGLRRLRLSSSASITSTTSTSRAPSAPQRPAPTGPQARSPTAAGKTPVVSVGSKRGLRSGQNSPTPSRQGQVMSGPPRPLLTGVGRVTRQGSAGSTPSSPAISSPLSPTVRAESPAPLRLPSSSRTSSLPSHSRNPSSTSQPPTPTSPAQSIRTQRSTASVRSATSRATAASTSMARMPAATASSTAAKPNGIKPVRGESSAAKPASTVRSRTVSTAEVKPSRVSDTAKPTRPIASSSRLSDTAVTRQRTVSTASKAPDVTARARTVSTARAESLKLTSTLATRTREHSTTAPSETKPPAVRTRTVSTASRAPEPKPTPSTRTRTLSTATTSTGPGTAAAAAASRQRTLSAASTRSRAPSMSSLAPSVGTVASRTSTTSAASTAAKARASTGSMRTTASSSKAPAVPKVVAKPTAAARATPAVRPTPSTAAKAGPSTAKTSSSTPAKAAPIAPSKAASMTVSRPPALRTSASTKSLASSSSLGARASPVPRTPTTSTKTVTPSASSSRLTATTPRTRATSLNTQATPPPRPRTSSSHTPWKRATPLPPTVAGVAGQRGPRQRPSLRSLSGSTEGPPEAITPRVSDATEPILVLDEDNELTFERENERDADKVPPVPPIPESLRRRSTAEVVVEVSVPEEDEDELEEELAIPQVIEEAPSDSESVYENIAYDETASNRDSAYAESDRDSTYQESVASAVPSVVSRESVASEHTAFEHTEDEHNGSFDGSVERSADQSNGALVDQPDDTSVDEAEMAADAAERTTPPASTHAPSPNGTPTPRERGRETEPPLTLNRDSEREAKTPTPASPFPPSRTRTPTASSQASLTSQASVGSHSSASQRPQSSHTSLAPAPALRSPISADQFRPVTEHLRSPASTDQLRPAHLRSPPTTRAPLPIPTLRAPGASPPSPPRYLSANARSPRSSYSSSPMSVISRVASESGSLRSLNSGWHPAHAFDPPKKAAAPTPLPPPPTPEEQDGCEPYSGPGVHLHIGIPAIVTRGRRRFRANVKYLGTLASRSGAWVGLEIQDRELGMDTLPTGAIDGIRYFHFTPPPDIPDDNDKGDRLRRIAMIADEFRRTPNQNQNKLGLGLMRSASPFSITDGGPERPRAMFVRPSDVLFVMGSGE